MNYSEKIKELRVRGADVRELGNEVALINGDHLLLGANAPSVDEIFPDGYTFEELRRLAPDRCRRCGDERIGKGWAGRNDLDADGKPIPGGMGRCGDLHDWEEYLTDADRKALLALAAEALLALAIRVKPVYDDDNFEGAEEPLIS